MIVKGDTWTDEQQEGSRKPLRRKSSPSKKRRSKKRRRRWSRRCPKPTRFAPRLESAQNDLAAEKDKNLRLRAEYDNFRKRSARERDNIYADVKADTLKKLLPIFDNLERALRQETADEAYKKGVEMTMTQFLEALQALGVTPIEAVGQKFDPNEHNAVMHMEDPEKGEGEIVQEFQKGFEMGDRVIRFSMVQVAN